MTRPALFSLLQHSKEKSEIDYCIVLEVKGFFLKVQKYLHFSQQ